MASIGRLDVYAFLGLLFVAAYYTYDSIWGGAQLGAMRPSFDIYHYSYPNFIYAHEALRRGYGLLWNDLQNCGQPFFGILSSALLYPSNLLFLAGHIHEMIFVHAVLNLTIVGIGMYLFCREIRLGALAALCGALVFQMGGDVRAFANWNFALLAPYAWLPWGMFFAERILRSPSAGAGIGLGVVLTLQLLAGYPQIQVFTYQLIGLRALFELATRRGDWPRVRALGVLALGLTLPVLLAAVQFLPSLEVAAESVRAGSLSFRESDLWGMGFEAFRHLVSNRLSGSGTILSVVGVALASFFVAAPTARRVAWFALAVMILFSALALVEPVYELYRKLPVVGSLFRHATRFLWVTSFAFGVLVACGVDAVARARVRSRLAQGALILACLAAIAGFRLLSSTGLTPLEWWLGAGTLAACALPVVFGRARLVARLALPALLFVNLYWTPAPSMKRHLVDGSLLYEKQRAFAAVKERLTAQDRMYQVGLHGDPSLMDKSASVFGIPSITDYEPQTSRRYAELFVRTFKGAPMRDLNQYIYLLRNLPKSRPLLNLLAARYVLVDASPGWPGDRTGYDKLRPPLRLVWEDGDLRVYENWAALPRAFYVPRAEVIPDRAQLLERLASRRHRPRRVALLEEPPADGFIGVPRAGPARVEILSGRGETLSVRVRAPQDGFLFVSDQYYPGWEASVDGEPTPIYRANYAFRLVRVPKGQSEVVFRYKPKSLRIGAAISLATLLALAAYATRVGRRRLRARSRESGSMAAT